MPDHHLHDLNRGDDTTITGARAAEDQPRENPAGEAPRGKQPVIDVLTLVCEQCGKDYFFDTEPPPPGIQCAKCGGTVFRQFNSNVGDEASDDFRDETERDLDPDDAEGDVLPGDIMDLNNL